jgi:deoxyribodipyrimidine photolyase-related protein
VIDDVRKVLPGLPGDLSGEGYSFNWPVTRKQAVRALDDFIENRLPHFGDYQDAMWTGERTLYHSLLSSSLNLKLLNPREVYKKAIDAYESGDAPLNCVEGFVRQIIGWREFIRGIYFHQGKAYPRRNALDQHGDLPEFYWTADTDMACMEDCLSSVLESAYGHHIARLMVTGNFALISGIHPGRVHEWYLGMYVDAVEWATAPNTIGMALHADGGVVGTKPYAASGKYINRMSNYCKECRYDVNKRIGEDACPFNTFYWDFLIRNERTFKSNQRMSLILKNVAKLSKETRVEITSSARALRKTLGIGGISR